LVWAARNYFKKSKTFLFEAILSLYRHTAPFFARQILFIVHFGDSEEVVPGPRAAKDEHEQLEQDGLSLS
jgi:hypothetical protein